MRILIVFPIQHKATGNRITATRFEKGLSEHGHEVSLFATPLEPADLAREVAATNPDLVLLLHAYRSGKPWMETAGASSIPHVVLLTGTDVNEGLLHPKQGPIIETVLRQATAVLTQNRLAAEALHRDRPDLTKRLHYLPPGIELGCTPYPLKKKHHLPKDKLLFFCPASLRPVKGVLELLELLDPLARDFSTFHIAFCGPSLDRQYSNSFFAALGKRPWASYLGVIPPGAMAAAMREADVVLNNSLSEGLPNALVEATVLGRPILARDIPGNAAIVEEAVNGLLYSDGTDFIRAAARLLSDPALRTQLSRPRPGRYDRTQEAERLDSICLQVLAPGEGQSR